MLSLWQIHLLSIGTAWDFHFDHCLILHHDESMVTGQDPLPSLSLTCHWAVGRWSVSGREHIHLQ